MSVNNFFTKFLTNTCNIHIYTGKEKERDLEKNIFTTLFIINL